MDKNQIREKIIDILINGVHVNKKRLEGKENPDFIKDLEMDSLSLLELVEKVEKEFDIEVEDEELEKLSDMESVVNFIETKIKK
ncbi:MAG: acyl carrier protein [Caldiserica bacterium]|nr:MAG: acyl carrier protein [Caldisericota bacterium]